MTAAASETVLLLSYRLEICDEQGKLLKVVTWTRKAGVEVINAAPVAIRLNTPKETH